MTSDVSTSVYSSPYTKTSSVSKNENAKDELFADTFNSASTNQSELAQKNKSKREIEHEATDAQIKAFFEKMKKDGGAQNFLVKMNIEKIEDLIKKREEELKAANGVYNNPPLSPDQLKDALKAVKEGVEEYKKQLLKELEEKAKKEKNSHVSTEIQSVSNISNTAKVKPKITSLADLLSVI